MAIVEQKDLYTSLGTPRTTSLILETSRQGDEPLFTLSIEKEGYVSLQKLFISYTIDDPTEVVFAQEVFGDVGYWLTLREATRLKPHVEKWRQVAELSRKQKAFKAVINEIENEGRGSLQAARFLIEEPWKDKRKKTTQESSKETTKKAFDSVSEDYRRLQEGGHIN